MWRRQIQNFYITSLRSEVLGASFLYLRQSTNEMLTYISTYFQNMTIELLLRISLTPATKPMKLNSLYNIEPWSTNLQLTYRASDKDNFRPERKTHKKRSGSIRRLTSSPTLLRLSRRAPAKA